MAKLSLLSGVAARIRRIVLSLARRVGWVRLGELKSAEEQSRQLSQRVSEEAAARRSEQDRSAQLSRNLSKATAALLLQRERTEGLLHEIRERKQAIVKQSEKLDVFRTKIAGQVEQLRRGQEHERQLIGAMRSRELAGAQTMAMVRSSLSRMRAGDQHNKLAQEESALLAEVGRLQELAQQQGQTLHRAYDVEHTLIELRAGRIAVAPFSIDALIKSAAAPRMLVLAASEKFEAGLKELAKRHSAEIRSVLSPDTDSIEKFDLVVTAFDLEDMGDPIWALRKAANLAASDGRLLLIGSAWASSIPLVPTLWRTPPAMFQSLLPEWVWDQFVLVGPGGQVGLEVIDPTILLEFRPALGKGAPLLAPPYMSIAAVAHKRSSQVHRFEN